MTKHCTICDRPFCPEQDHHIICPECFAEGRVDGSDQQYKVLRALDNLWTNATLAEDWTMIAESSAGAHIAENILKHMEAKCLRNLLRRVLRDA